MILCEPSNIFVPRNDWNVRAMKCKKVIIKSEYIDKVAVIIKDEVGADPFDDVFRRTPALVQARYVFMGIMAVYSKLTYEEIASLVGKDHSTVNHAFRYIKNYRDTDKKFEAMYCRILTRVREMRNSYTQ